ncbi:hypothetical protein F383_25563 [Gossypium arboreum]|uniref:Uncharacterized protein n=3 Tax=Gossypium arboreum TaxID=29729 RepID=A0A0B0PB54_GOSAR|nr:hypothetical protein F383_25563 [Gossypium arboreum]
MCCRKDLARTGNSLISIMKRIYPGWVFLWMIEPPKEYMCIMDLARTGNPIRV